MIKDDTNFKVQDVILENGTKIKGVVMKTAIYVKEYRRYLAIYIHGVLEAANGLLDYCELEMIHIGNNGKESGIISLKLR